jgi:photosystem II stability/assembly factor-like uncharacterized protein
VYFFTLWPNFLHNMKIGYFLPILLLIGAVYFSKNQPIVAVHIPSGAQEENKEDRAAWDKMRLADPLTGEIPLGISYLERQFAAQIPIAAQERGGAGTWEVRGPWNVGGRTRALALDVTDPNHIFAGGVSGGLWESTDAGQSWQRRTPLNAHPGVVSIAQDTRPGKTNNWYYISGEITGTSASGGSAFYLGDGMFKSTNNGQTWTAINSTANGSAQLFTDVWQTGWRVITDPTAPSNQDVLYAATYGAIWRSINGGSNWTAVRGGQTGTSYYTDVAITSTGVLYAVFRSGSVDSGVWRSTNGTTWTKIAPTTGFPTTYDRFVIGINPNNENEVYILGSTPGFGHYNRYIDSDDWTSLWKYNYVSGDGSGAGGTWTDLSLNLPNIGTQFDKFAAQGGYDLVVKVQPGTNNVFVGGTNLYRSTDGFTTPNNTTHIGGYKPGTELPYFELYPNHHPDVHDVVFHPTEANVMISASDGGLHRTENCNAPVVEWSYLNSGYRTSQFYTAIIDKNTANDSTIIGGLQDNGNFFVNSKNTTAPWKQTVNGDGAFGAIPAGKPFYILSIQKGRLVKCNIDNQGNVTAFRRFDPIGPGKDDYQFINPLIMDPIDQNTLYLPAGRHFYRQNKLSDIQVNNQWDSIAQGWVKSNDTIVAINDMNAEHRFSAVAVSSANPAHRVYLGTTRGKLFKVENANTAAAPVLVPLNLPNATNTNYVSCIAVDPDDADKVVLVYSNYITYSIFISTNGGTSWKKAAGNLEQSITGQGNGPSIRWISILPLPDGKRKYFCGTSVGLYSADTLKEHISANTGTQWVQEAQDLIGNTVINHIEVRPSDGLVVVATHGTGMYSANFTATSGINEPKTLANVQVWPNPASDVVRCSWQQGDPTVQVKMYDQSGRVVRNTPLSGGTGQIPIRDLPNGIYYYEITGRGWTKTGKLVH